MARDGQTLSPRVRNVFCEDLALHPPEREIYLMARLQGDLVTQDVNKKEGNLRTVRRFDDAVSSWIDAFDRSLHAVTSRLAVRELKLRIASASVV